MNDTLFWLGQSTSGMLQPSLYRLVFAVPPANINLAQMIPFKNLSNSYMQPISEEIDYTYSKIYVVIQLNSPVNLGQTNIAADAVNILALGILGVSLEEIQKPFTVSQAVTYFIILLIGLFLMSK
jgi:hypothetical protein